MVRCGVTREMTVGIDDEAANIYLVILEPHSIR